MAEKRDGDRIVVTGYSAGSHFPRKEEMIAYAWEANGSTRDGPFIIPGSVYGRQLRFVGRGSVGGSVLSRGDISLVAPATGSQRFIGGLAANGNIGAQPRQEGMRKSLVGDIQKASYIIRGEVLADNVYLENAVVFGNIRATNISLRHCVVFGAIMAKEVLTVTASTILYYHTRDIVFEGPCTLIHALGESRTRPRFEPYEDAASHLWPGDVRFYPILRSSDGPMSNRPWTTGSELYTGAKLYPEHDWVRCPVTEKRQKAINGKLEQIDVPSERWVLALGGRILNLAALGAVVSDVYGIIRSGLEFGHYEPRVQNETRANWSRIATPDERWMLEQVTSPMEQVVAA
jgi:hypothetical protein